MPLTSLLFLGSFFAGCAASLRYPIIGVITYMGVYFLAAQNQWWFKSIQFLNIRFFFVAGICLAVAMALNWRSIRPRIGNWTGLEWFLLLFLALAWLSVPLGFETTDMGHIGIVVPQRIVS